jgi:hypothetical protein
MDVKANLEFDLFNSDWLINKCKKSKKYSQNLYAALCNNLFYKNDEEWSCSWRYAGGIVADLNETGDYMDWYCSGICANETTGYVVEGDVTSEISNDMLNLGWHHKPYES